MKRVCLLLAAAPMLLAGCSGHPNERDVLHFVAGGAIAIGAGAATGDPNAAFTAAAMAGAGKEMLDHSRGAPADPIDAALTAVGGAIFSLLWVEPNTPPQQPGFDWVPGEGWEQKQTLYHMGWGK